MAFRLAKVLGNSHATHGSGLALTNFMSQITPSCAIQYAP